MLQNNVFNIQSVPQTGVCSGASYSMTTKLSTLWEERDLNHRTMTIGNFLPSRSQPKTCALQATRLVPHQHFAGAQTRRREISLSTSRCHNPRQSIKLPDTSPAFHSPCIATSRVSSWAPHFPAYLELQTDACNVFVHSVSSRLPRIACSRNRDMQQVKK